MSHHESSGVIRSHHAFYYTSNNTTVVLGLQLNFWPRYDQKRDLPYLDMFKSLAFLTKSKILM